MRRLLTQHSAIIKLPSLPITLNGKTDRRALEKLALESAVVPKLLAYDEAPFGGPKSSCHEIVCAAWAAALAIPELTVNPDQDFYEAGGDSISAIRVAAACRAAGYRFSIVDFKHHSTVRAQAALLESRSQTKSLTDVQYKPFELLSQEGYRRAVILEAEVHGLNEDDVQDAYPCAPSVSGLISLAVANPLVCTCSISRCILFLKICVVFIELFCSIYLPV